MFLPVSVCLSICLLARLLKNVCMDLDEMLHVDRCWDMDKLIDFELDPDYSLNARTGLLSPISFKRCYARNFTSGKSDVYVLAAAATHDFKMVLRPTTAARHGFNVVSLSQSSSSPMRFMSHNW